MHFINSQKICETQVLAVTLTGKTLFWTLGCPRKNLNVGMSTKPTQSSKNSCWKAPTLNRSLVFFIRCAPLPFTIFVFCTIPRVVSFFWYVHSLLRKNFGCAAFFLEFFLALCGKCSTVSYLDFYVRRTTFRRSEPTEPRAHLAFSLSWRVRDRSASNFKTRGGRENSELLDLDRYTFHRVFERSLIKGKAEERNATMNWVHYFRGGTFSKYIKTSGIVKLTNFQIFLWWAWFIILNFFAGKHHFRLKFDNLSLEYAKFPRSRLQGSHVSVKLG